MAGWPEAALDLLFPPVCVVCQRALCAGTDPPRVRWRGQGLCRPCAEAMPWMPHPCCPLCAKPFPSAAVPPHACGDCLLAPPPFDSARALLIYRHEVFPIVHEMKYAPRPALARFFGFLMGNAFGEALMGVCADAVVPVPLHGRRLRQRGFNQAVLMAEGLHRSLNVRILRDGLLRWRWTDPQVSLSRPRREANMRGAFRVPRPSAVEGRRLILLDDVYTTGSTLREAARALKEAGARQVHVVALARVL